MQIWTFSSVILQQTNIKTSEVCEIREKALHLSLVLFGTYEGNSEILTLKYNGHGDIKKITGFLEFDNLFLSLTSELLTV
jgi:hypothetical protein